MKDRTGFASVDKGFGFLSKIDERVAAVVWHHLR